MDARFTVLASGSSGNASLLEAAGFGLLIDCGVAPRTLGHRLAAVGSSWNAIHAVVLTHTHGDHWKDATLARLRSLRIPIFAHAAHFDDLSTAASHFESLHTANLTRPYRENETLTLGPGLACQPILVPHDAEPTFAFRIEGRDGAGVPAWAVGYASDLGCVPAGLPEAFAGVDVLAVEFNHDEHLERSSARPAYLINRVLGNTGHLSNHQAGEFTRQVLGQSGEHAARFVVQLHLSRQCNTPAMALAAGQDAMAASGRAVTIVTARQDVPTRTIPLERCLLDDRAATFATVLPVRKPHPRPVLHYQPRLPGFGA